MVSWVTLVPTNRVGLSWPRTYCSTFNTQKLGIQNTLGFVLNWWFSHAKTKKEEKKRYSGLSFVHIYILAIMDKAFFY